MRNVMSGILVVAASLVFASSFPVNVHAEPIELSLNLGIPESHLRYQHAIKPWIERIEKGTDGRVKISPYFMASLCPRAEAYNSAVAGLVDISEGIQHITPGRFPLTEVMLLPSVAASGKHAKMSAAEVMWSLYEAFPEIRAEYKDVKVLCVYACAPEVLMTRDKKVDSLADAKGLKIHINGRTKVNTGNALGMTPISMPYGDVYLSLEKGVIDGGIWPEELLKSRRFGEQLDYVTPLNLSHTCFFLVMNQQKWDSLPGDIQAVFEEESGRKFAVEESKAEGAMRTQAHDWAVKTHGVEYVEITQGMMDKWDQISQESISKWEKEMEDKGLPGKKVYQMRRKLESGG